MLTSAHSPYGGGFLLAKEGREALTSLPKGELAFRTWQTRRVGPYSLHFDPMFPCSASEVGDCGVVCLGYICDVVTGEDAWTTVRQHAQAYALSRNAFLERLHDCGGTFILFAYRRDVVEVFLDACGTVAACYTCTGDETRLASHPNLLAELYGFKLSPLAEYWLGHPKTDLAWHYFPGLKTAFDEVRLLTPNTTVELPSGHVSRFYPTHDLQERLVEDITEAVAPVLWRQATWIAHRANLGVSLSGGLDTRVTLAAMKPVAGDCFFFTYNVWDNPILETDMEIATRLTSALGLRHELVAVTQGASIPAQFREDWSRTNGPNESVWAEELVYGYETQLAGEFVHVRSNLMEVVRGSYTKFPKYRENSFDAATLSRLFRFATTEEFKPYFEEYIEVTDFRPESIRNYHYADLFHWEHRQGTWLAGHLRGMRTHHLTFMLYNCRRIIEAMLARPIDERNAATVTFALLRKMWPEVLNVPVFSGAKFMQVPGTSPNCERA